MCGRIVERTVGRRQCRPIRCWRLTVRRERISAGRRDRRAGQQLVHHLRFADEHLQYVVQYVAGARYAFGQIRFGQQAHGFAVHLELVQIEFGQIEFSFAELQKYGNIVTVPDARIGRQLGGQLGFQFGQWTGRRRVSPQKVCAPHAGRCTNGRSDQR